MARGPEYAFMGSIVKLAHAAGFAVMNVRPAFSSEKGWRTPFASDGVGWPDLTLVKPGCPILFRELKSDTGKLSANQEAWGQLILKAGGDWSVWRPRDLDRICEELGVAARSIA